MDIIKSALEETNEGSQLDFKSKVDLKDPGDCLEIVKDVVAFANSGGGVILVGLQDDGTPSGVDISGLIGTDPADLTNQIHKYTGSHFSGFEFIECKKGAHDICAIRIAGCHVPLVFSKVGTYEVAKGKQKAVFSMGTVYFRHGAKSEPGTTEDLRNFLDREVERVKNSWLDGITKVVEAPAGSRFAVLPPESHPAGPSGAIPLKLTTDPTAPAYYAVPIDTTHPYRQKEVVKEVNVRLAGKKAINTHDILCIRRVFSIQKDIKHCYTQNFASPRYSQAFVDWVVSKYEEDNTFFESTKKQFDAIKSGTQ